MRLRGIRNWLVNARSDEVGPFAVILDPESCRTLTGA